ncbi:MAG: hypothetical protein WDM70_06470 [Nitrosomonadales bacterium]
MVDVINHLHLSRYGLGKYSDPLVLKYASTAERKQMDDLGKAGKRLIGFCRTNLFKRLESSGFSFMQSIERHILRNEIYLHAIDNGLDLPIGTLDAGILDADRFDEDAEGSHAEQEDLLDGVIEEAENNTNSHAELIYRQYADEYRKRFKWINSRLFKKELREHLAEDIAALRKLLKSYGTWNVGQDRNSLNWKILLHELMAMTKFWSLPSLPTPPAIWGAHCKRVASGRWHQSPAPLPIRMPLPAAFAAVQPYANQERG